MRIKLTERSSILKERHLRKDMIKICTKPAWHREGEKKILCTFCQLKNRTIMSMTKWSQGKIRTNKRKKCQWYLNCGTFCQRIIVRGKSYIGWKVIVIINGKTSRTINCKDTTLLAQELAEPQIAWSWDCFLEKYDHFLEISFDSFLGFYYC